jgi:hypothetical protein
MTGDSAIGVSAQNVLRSSRPVPQRRVQNSLGIEISPSVENLDRVGLAEPDYPHY